MNVIDELLKPSLLKTNETSLIVPLLIFHTSDTKKELRSPPQTGNKTY